MRSCPCAGGNSFNQLAVLATYNEAHLQAVCHYFRSLAVAHPFQVSLFQEWQAQS